MRGVDRVVVIHQEGKTYENHADVATISEQKGKTPASSVNICDAMISSCQN